MYVIRLSVDATKAAGGQICQVGKMEIYVGQKYVVIDNCSDLFSPPGGTNHEEK